MIRAACLLVVVAACDFGIGSDPHTTNPCAPGHSRASTDEACLAPMAAITIDGDTGDWAAVPTFPISTTTSIAIAGNADGDSDLLVRVVYGSPPPADAELGIALSPSPVRPASGGSDRITLTPAGFVYVKNGLTLTPAVAQAELARTGDGFEARILQTWLSYQGAATVSIITSGTTSSPVNACWGWRNGPYRLPSTACEVTP